MRLLDSMMVVVLASALLAMTPPAHAADAHAAAHGAHGRGAEAPVGNAGKPGDPARATRTITIRMNDNMRFEPAKIVVKRGETVRFRVTNAGKLEHEMVIGTPAELEAHAAMMRAHGDMQHDDGHAAQVAPGKTKDMVWQFTKAGKFKYACLVPGHFETGMVGDIEVR